MFNPGDVFQLVIDCLDYGSLAKQYFVIHRPDTAFYIVLQLGEQLYSVNEQFADVSLVVAYQMQLESVESPQKHFPHTAMPLNISCMWIRWLRNTRNKVLSTKLMLVHLPKRHFFTKITTVQPPISLAP